MAQLDFAIDFTLQVTAVIADILTQFVTKCVDSQGNPQLLTLWTSFDFEIAPTQSSVGGGMSFSLGTPTLFASGTDTAIWQMSGSAIDKLNTGSYSAMLTGIPPTGTSRQIIALGTLTIV